MSIAGTAPKKSALEVSRAVITAAMKVHSALGPGLLESAYEACLAHELRRNGLKVETQVELPIEFEGTVLDVGYRIDMLVEDLVLVELKATAEIHPVVKAQIISYLKLSNKTLGLLINFHVTHLREGIKRFVRGSEWK
jgi:GxxExxY protein